MPVDGVEPVEEPPAVALAELPVEAEADEPPDPGELADVEVFVVVDALAEPPGVGSGWAKGSGSEWATGSGSEWATWSGRVGVGVGLCVVAGGPSGGMRPPHGRGPSAWVPESGWASDRGGARGRCGLWRAVRGRCGASWSKSWRYSDEPPLIDGFTLMIGWTMITGELLTFATALARAPAPATVTLARLMPCDALRDAAQAPLVLSDVGRPVAVVPAEVVVGPRSWCSLPSRRGREP